MDLLGIAALGGLERITIVAGAIIIGYWGYRLYTAEKKAGLVFMGLAVVVLAGALATGTSHVKNVAEGFQLASAPIMAPVPPSAISGMTVQLHDAAVADDHASFMKDDAAVEAEDAAQTVVAVEVEVTADADAEQAPDLPQPANMAEGTDKIANAATAAASPVRLATGQELGGRIVSVQSENVSLEWSNGSN